MNQRFHYVNPKIHAHANGMPCQNCEAEDGTTVFAHSNMAEHGKCKGRKAHSLFGAFLCVRCHSWLDQGKGRDPTGVWQGDRQDKREMFLKAMFRTQIILLRDGVIG
ncbi:MAG TPA: nuclease domain-containing protein [Sideroxyarcus sp.]|nr:nuclease domain-containing protein [Sideroxyarcus sp.]